MEAELVTVNHCNSLLPKGCHRPRHEFIPAARLLFVIVNNFNNASPFVFRDALSAMLN